MTVRGSRRWQYAYYLIPQVAALIITFATGLLVVSYSDGVMGPRTPSYGAPFPWMTVGYFQGCMAATPGCYYYAFDWVFLTLDVLFFTTIGFVSLTAYFLATKKIPHFLTNLRLDRKMTRRILAATLIATAFVPVVAAAVPLFSPCVNCLEPFESISIFSSQTNSPTNLTITIGNDGTMQAILVAYYVWPMGQYGDRYANANWPGPTIGLNDAVTTNLLIDGMAFTFQPGNQYTIEIVSSRNNHYWGTITS